jgi:hypothetical protein
MKPVRVEVNDLMQKGYVYFRTKPIGRDFRAGFAPELTPKEMLQLGVFGGKYMTDCTKEFPASWFKKAKLCPERHESSLNFFGVNASQPLATWRKKGWIYHEDPAAGFSGIAGTIPVADVSTTYARSSDGAPCDGISRN